MVATKYSRFEIEAELIGDYADDVLWRSRKAQFAPVTHTIDEIMIETVTGRLAPLSPTFVTIETNILFDTLGDGNMLLIRNLSDSNNLEISADFGSNSRQARQIKPGKFMLIDYFNGSSNDPRVSGIGAACPFAMYLASAV